MHLEPNEREIKQWNTESIIIVMLFRFNGFWCGRMMWRQHNSAIFIQMPVVSKLIQFAGISHPIHMRQINVNLYQNVDCRIIISR